MAWYAVGWSLAYGRENGREGAVDWYVGHGEWFLVRLAPEDRARWFFGWAFSSTSTTISMRRFAARPAAVSFVSRGSVSARHTAPRRGAASP